MVIVETSIFTKRVQELLPDDEYRLLQATLVQQPDMGVVIPESGGLRKVRWATPGRGKQGGARIIYYWAVAQERLLMLYIYPKSERGDLSKEQIKVLRKITEEQYP